MNSLIKYLWWIQFRLEFELDYYMHDTCYIDSEAFAVREEEGPLCPQPEMAVWRVFLHIKFKENDIA